MNLINKKMISENWFHELKDQFINHFEEIENSNSEKKIKFKKKEWKRKPNLKKSSGGGTMTTRYGKIFEKVGVNVSTVHGKLSVNFRNQIPGTKIKSDFWASGISIVAHMQNPYVPSFHFLSLIHI
mgnify:CR=1 FL=1